MCMLLPAAASWRLQSSRTKYDGVDFNPSMVGWQRWVRGQVHDEDF